jgi:hypothetical protein
MKFIDDAIQKGISAGFQEYLTDICSGKDNPEDRCPMKSSDCVCYYVAYQKAPFWKRWRMEKPNNVPNNELILKTITELRIKKVLNEKNTEI